MSAYAIFNLVNYKAECYLPSQLEIANSWILCTGPTDELNYRSGYDYWLSSSKNNEDQQHETDSDTLATAKYDRRYHSSRWPLASYDGNTSAITQRKISFPKSTTTFSNRNNMAELCSHVTYDDLSNRAAWAWIQSNPISACTIPLCQQELIKRWDSKRQLFTTIWHVRT